MALLKLISLCLFLAFAVVPVRAEQVARWRPYVEEASARFSVPPEWIERVMHAESGGRTTLDGRPIVSSAGAMGLMQLMPGTWADMRARLGLGPDPHAPRDNILAGTLYLRLMHDRFGYPGLFAAYNAGPARYAAVLAGKSRLPRETRAYLAAVSGQMRARPGRGKPIFAGGRSALASGRDIFLIRRDPLVDPPMKMLKNGSRVGTAAIPGVDYNGPR